MSATLLLADLIRHGIRLEVLGDRLRYSPRSAVTPELTQRLRTHKAELFAILRRDADRPEVDRTNATSVWKSALSQLECNRLFPPDVMEALRTADARWGHAEAVKTAPAKWRCRCGSTTHRDVPIHGGRSVRRDCARCERFIEFVKWYDH